MPSTLTGSLHPSNKDAIAWHDKGVVAFGCHSTLVFVDVMRLEIFQTIEFHKAPINLVAWRPACNFLRSNDFELKCASSDIGGRIHVWDVLTANSLANFSHANHTVIDMKWYEWRDAECNFLFSLHSNSTLVLWNAILGEKLWDFRFPVNVFKFDIDPFDASNLTLASVGSNLLLVSEASVKKPPTNANISQIVVRPHDKSTRDTSFVQVKFHRAYSNLVFAVFTNEVLCLEVQSQQIVYSAIIETHTSLFQILPCARRDAFFLVHHNGFISFRVAQVDYCDERLNAKLAYRRACYSEAQRASNRLRLMGAAVCPVGEVTVAMLYNSGKIVFHQLGSKEHGEVQPYRIRYIEDYVSLSHELSNVYSDLKLSQYGLIASMCSSVTAVRVRPLDTTVPLESCRLNRIHLAAIATSVGTVHLVNLLTGRIERDLQIHSCPIKCLEWGGNNILISGAYTASLSSSATVRNDVFLTDIRTGTKKRLRQEADESPIELIRVSFYQCYLAISFHNDPLEIWELNSMRLLRRMSQRCPVIVDMTWSHKVRDYKTTSDVHIYRESLVVLDNDNHLYHVIIKGLHVKDGKEVTAAWRSGATQLRCLLWKDEILAFGDSAGRLGIWDLKKATCLHTGMNQSTRGPVLKCVFSRLAGDNTLAVQHPTSVVLWDTDRLQAIQSFQHAGLSIIDVDMCGMTPVYLASDGMFRFAYDDRNSRNVPVSEAETPILLRKDFVAGVRKCLNVSGRLDESASQNAIENLALEGASLIQREDMDTLKCVLKSTPDFSSKAIFLLKYLGEMALSRFVNVVFNCGEKSNEEGIAASRLATNLQLFWSSNFYRKRVEQLTSILLSCCKTDKQLEQGIEKCIIMGKNELATYFLLNNDNQLRPSAPDFRLNALRACLLSADLSSEESQCMVKLTATNLIASNYMTDGIQLLFLIDQGLDACKYLLSQGLWAQSVAYSKLHPHCDFDEILLRYADHLLNEQVAFKTFAILILVSLRKWARCRILIKGSTTDPSVQDFLEDILNLAERNSENLEIQSSQAGNTASQSPD